MNKSVEISEKEDQVKLLRGEIETCTDHLSKITDALMPLQAMLLDAPRRREENLEKLLKRTALTAHQIDRLVSYVEENRDLPNVLYQWLKEDSELYSMYESRDHMLISKLFAERSGESFSTEDIRCEMKQAGTPLANSTDEGIEQILQSLEADLLVHACYRSSF
jgi:hypothetical protein